MGGRGRGGEGEIGRRASNAGLDGSIRPWAPRRSFPRVRGIPSSPSGLPVRSCILGLEGRGERGEVRLSGYAEYYVQQSAQELSAFLESAFPHCIKGVLIG